MNASDTPVEPVDEITQPDEIEPAVEAETAVEIGPAVDVESPLEVGRSTPVGPWWRRYRVLVPALIVLSFVVGSGVTAATFAIADAARVHPASVPEQMPQPFYTDDGRTTADNAMEALTTYLGYVAQGDAESANLMSPPPVSGAYAVFLTNDVLSHAKERISAVNVTSATAVSAGTYEVLYSYELDSAKHEASSRVFRKSDHWVIESVAQTLNVSAGAETRTLGFSIAGHDAQAEFLDDNKFGAYPAVYEIDPPTNGFFDGETVTLSVLALAVVERNDGTVVAAERPTAAFSFGFSDAFGAEIQRVNTEMVDSCLTVEGIFGSTDDARLGRPCGEWALQQYEEVSDLSLEVVNYPVAAVEYEDFLAARYRATGGILRLSFTAVDTSSGSTERQTFTGLEIEMGIRSNIIEIHGDTLILP